MSREQNIRKALKAQIETKLYFQDVKRDIPPEGMINVEKQLTVQFEKTELPKLMKQEGVTSARDLEKKLNSRCSSIAQEKKRFFRTLLVNEWMRKQIKPDELPTVTQMVHYYEAHKLDTDFTTPAKVRWEELTVNKSKYSNNAEALAAISQLGNRVLVNKEPFDAVAKDASDGFTAMKGGFRDWAAKGSLTDKEIEKALFSSSLPVGQLSQIIETPQDYNIVRVIERVDQKTEDFHSAQDKIRTLIKNERIERQFHEYLDRLEKRTPIWTVYDGNGDGKPLSERLNEDKSPLKTPGANGEMLGRAGRTNEVQR
jgi:hypothetical protein